MEDVPVERFSTEIACGPFHRAFTLPASADAAAVRADYRLGILHIAVPFGLYTEASGWLCDWDGFGADRTQLDTNGVAGLSYRF